jgi:hypothetical protein
MEQDNCKVFKSKNYNYIFNNSTGLFLRWGENYDDDPQFSPYGPEILDLEVSTICNGIEGIPCNHCYKSNTGQGKNMSFEEFKIIFNKIPRTLTQIAFGIGNITSNPDLFNMFHYCRNNDYNSVIPNVTINGYGMTDYISDKLVNYCGAVSVSRYKKYDYCYNTVKMLTDKGMKQVNIHMLLCKETYEDCFRLMKDAKKDKRLENLRAILFLMMKPKGKRNNLTLLKDQELYKRLIDYAIENKINIGFDSCSAPVFLNAVKDSKNFKYFDMICESCESSLFSSYINVDGRYYHCSFTEGEDPWEGIDVLNSGDFLSEVWFGEETVKFRKSLINQEHSISKTCRLCPIFDLYSI